VLSILAGEISVAEAARPAKVSEQSVGNWKRQFLEAGRARLAAGKTGPSTREPQLGVEAADLAPSSGPRPGRAPGQGAVVTRRCRRCC